MCADDSASRYYRPQGKQTCSCQLPRMDIPSSKSIQSQIWRKLTAKIDKIWMQTCHQTSRSWVRFLCPATSIMLRLTTQSLRIMTLNNGGPLCVCTTHMQVKDPPPPILKEKPILGVWVQDNHPTKAAELKQGGHKTWCEQTNKKHNMIFNVIKHDMRACKHQPVPDFSSHLLSEVPVPETWHTPLRIRSALIIKAKYDYMIERKNMMIKELASPMSLSTLGSTVLIILALTMGIGRMLNGCLVVDSYPQGHSTRVCS